MTLLLIKRKIQIAVVLFVFTLLNAASAQTNKQKSLLFKAVSPDYDHYTTLGRLSKTPTRPNDTLEFPGKEFTLQHFLKLRIVYLQLPVNYFKISAPPANSSVQTRAELDFLIELQKKATMEDSLAAENLAKIYYNPFTSSPYNADYSRNMHSLFYIGKELGPWFNSKDLPITTKLLENVIQDATYYYFALKEKFSRPRPYHLDARIKAPEAPGHPAYPSGHASTSYIYAFLLAKYFPEKKDLLFTKAYDMAFSREVRGVHFPGDSQAGKQFAFQFVQTLYKNKKFLADAKKMKEELLKFK